MASRLANLLVSIPKHKGSCYQAIAKFKPDRKSTATRKASRSCCRISRSRSNSAIDSNSHVRSYSQPTMGRKYLIESQFTQRNKSSDQTERMEENYEVEDNTAREEQEIEENTSYYDSPDKDSRLYDSARELASQDRMRAMSQATMRGKEVPVEPVQYELEATRPREPVKYFDVFGHFTNMYRTREERTMPHLQPSNLRPFGSTNTLMSPVLIRTTGPIKYPIVDTHEAHSAGQVARSSDRDSDDMQRRGFSTYKSLRVKENPGYKPTNKMSQLVKSKEKPAEETGTKTSVKKNTESSAELKKCNEIIEKHRELNAKYNSHRSSETKLERKAINSASAFVDKYRFQKSSPSAATASNVESFRRKKLEIGDEITEKLNQDSSPQKEYKGKKALAVSEANLPWPEPEIQTPAEVRSTLPINILQTTASPEDSSIMEKVKLGPNQKLAVPWPAYSERIVAKKPSRVSVVYPALSPTEVVKPITKGDSLDSRIQVQTRGISTENKFRIEAGLFSNDCRLRHVLRKKEVIDSILQKSNAFKENFCRNKIGSISNGSSSIRYSSSSNQPTNEQGKRILRRVSIRKNRRKRKSLPNLKTSKCPCLQPKPSSDMKFKKLKPRFKVKEKPRICKIPCEDMTHRADEGLKLKRKELPIIVPAECPCVEKHMIDAPKLKRRTPRPVHERKKICPRPCRELMARADEGLTIRTKQLPILIPSDCPCFDAPPMKESSTLQRLDLYVPEPKRPRPKICSELIPRADEGLIVKSKELPKIVPTDCPFVEDCLKDIPRLKRLIPKPVAEPKKLCPVPCSEVTIRADDGMQIKSKELPKFSPSTCPCHESAPIKDVPPLQRLNLYVPEPKRIRPKTCSELVPRADASLSVKPKELPMVEPGYCPRVEQSMRDGPKLKRLIAKPVQERKKACKIPCHETNYRADEGMVIQAKELPTLESKYCPCFEPVPMQDVPPLRRLNLYVPEPKRVRPKTCSELIPRADEGLSMKPKELPMISPRECPCIEKSMKDVPRLKKRVPKPVVEPKRICAVPCEEVNIRSDEGRKIKKKALPTISPLQCPCLQSAPMKEAPSLKRLDLYVPEPERIRPKTCSELIPRADDCLQFKRKKLPYVNKGDCACPDLKVFHPAPQLSRPKFKDINEPERICLDDDYCEVNPRSDNDDWEYVLSDVCVEKGDTIHDATVRSSQKHRDSRLKPNIIMRRHFNTQYRFGSGINFLGPNVRKNIYRDHQSCGIHTIHNLSEIRVPKFPRSPFKNNLPWIGAEKNVTSTTANKDVLHNTCEEAECFFRRPISTNNFMLSRDSKKTKCGQRSKPALKVKCPKFNLNECPPRARTTCKRKPLGKKCVRQSSPYPSFSEVNEIDVDGLECECTNVEYLQPRNPIIKNPGPFNVPPVRHIDPSLEDACVRRKLGIPPPSGTAVCSVEITKKNLRQKDYIDKIEKLDMPKEAKEKESEKNEVCELEDEKQSDDTCCIQDKDTKKQTKRKSASDVEKCIQKCCKAREERERMKKMTLWEKIVDYFRARPDCPSAEEFRKMRLREKAEKAAAEAGLCVYDPEEMCDVKELPKVITAKDVGKESGDDKLQVDEDCSSEDVVKASSEKCEKQKFSCPESYPNSTPDFPKTESGETPKKDGQKAEKGKNLKASESLCQKLKQCLAGSVQKRNYSTAKPTRTFDAYYFLDDLIHGNDKTNSNLLGESELIVNALIDQGCIAVINPKLYVRNYLLSLGMSKCNSVNEIEKCCGEIAMLPMELRKQIHDSRTKKNLKPTVISQY